MLFFQKNWKSAKAFCVEHGMKLVTLKTAIKMKKLSAANPHKGITASKLY